MKNNKANYIKIVFLKKIIKIFISTLFITLLIGTLYIGYKFKPIYDKYKETATITIQQSDYSDFKTNQLGYIYNADGDIITELSTGDKSIYLKSEDIPDYVKKAFIAVEDRNFYNHGGFDLKGIARILIRFIQTGGKEQHGASTITQQLIKNTYLTPEKTIERKLTEILYAVEFEKKYSKEEILEFYINNVFFANRYYGIEAASLGYFNKSVSELTLSQIAFLCAIPNAPSYYNPLTNIDHTITRRNKILNDMHECGFISDRDLRVALNEEIILNTEYNNITFQNYEATYAIECAIRYLMQYDGFQFEYTWINDDVYKEYLNEYNEAYKNAKTKLYKDGYKIYTTISPNIQEKLQRNIDMVLAFDEEKQNNGVFALQGAATCIDNENGKVVAVVGGRTQENNNIYTLNRAYQSYRQPGSTIKPLVVYTPALENGYNKNSVLLDISVTEANKEDTDIDKLTGNPILLSYAVKKSINGAAIYLFNKIGIKTGLSYLTNMNFTKILNEDYNISAGLGGLTEGVTTEQMSGAYFSLFNHGNYINTTCIYSIIDCNGNEIFSDDIRKVYDDSAADNMTDILKEVLTDGTASNLKWYSHTKTDAAGKTGTTNDSKDGWFCGYTPYYTIAVWVGYDQPKTLEDLKGASYPAQIWCNTMLNIISDFPYKSFEKSENYIDPPVIYHGSANIVLTEDAYINYLPGRKDSEELSDNYTVYDFRVDRTIGEDVFDIVNQINVLDPLSLSYEEDLNNLYYLGLQIISMVYSTNYRNELTMYLYNAYIKS